MITLRKLASLPLPTRRRKCPLLCRVISQELLRGAETDIVYVSGLLELIQADFSSSERFPEIQVLCRHIRRLHLEEAGSRQTAWVWDDLYHLLLTTLGGAVADWDMVAPDGAGLDGSSRSVQPFRIYLDRVRSPYNVGSIFRTAESFGCERVFLAPGTASPDHPRAQRTSMGCARIIPWEYLSAEELKVAGRELGPFFVLESGGTSIDTFQFPPSGTLIIGSEELGVSPEALSLGEPGPDQAHGMGRVTIPMGGVKGSLNVSVAFGICMQRWFSFRHGGG